jgi:hypothetical protein
VTTYDDLEGVPSSELHDRAFKLAEKRHDIAFFWRLFKAIPEAEEVSGNAEESTPDLLHISRWLADFLDAHDLDDALRPFYVEYLVEHEK